LANSLAEVDVLGAIYEGYAGGIAMASYQLPLALPVF